jgi:hypothetical protein
MPPIYSVRIEPDPREKQRYADEQDYRKRQLARATTLNTITRVGTMAGLVGFLVLLGTLIITKQSVNTANRQLEASQRPWISFDMSIVGPLTFDTNGASMRTRFALRNAGPTPAVLSINTTFYTYTLNAQDTESERRKACLGRSPLPELLNETLFPGETTPNGVMPRPERILTLSKDEVKRMLTQQPLVNPTVIACIFYRATFNNTTRHTIKIYRVHSLTPAVLVVRPEDTISIPANQLALEIPFFDGTYAD